MILPHRTLGCRGTWHREPHDLLLYWRCSECQALAFPSREMNRAAIRENLLSYQLAQLTDEGKRLLRR